MRIKYEWEIAPTEAWEMPPFKLPIFTFVKSTDYLTAIMLRRLTTAYTPNHPHRQLTKNVPNAYGDLHSIPRAQTEHSEEPSMADKLTHSPG